MSSSPTDLLLLYTVLTNTTLSGDVKSKELVVVQPYNVESALIEYYYSNHPISSDFEHRKFWNETVPSCINQKKHVFSPQYMTKKYIKGVNVFTIDMKSKTINGTLCDVQTEKKYLNFKIRYYFNHISRRGFYETDWKQLIWNTEIQQEITNDSKMMPYVIGLLITILCFIINTFCIVVYNLLKNE